MARFCTYFTEEPYSPCMNLAEPGKYRCAEHRKQIRAGRPGDLTQAMRASILERDHGKCVKCGQPATEINHIKAFSKFAPEDRWKANLPSNLESLCMHDHAVITAKQRQDDIILDDPNDTSTSARNRKKKRLRKQGRY